MRAVQIKRRPVGALAEGCDSPVVSRVLAGRGCERAPDYALSGLLPPSLGGLDTACGLLADAIEQQRRLLVVGDFDADGATGTAVAVRGLRGLGASDVRWRMPDRVIHGYGLSEKLARECLDDQPDVVITVDHGVSSHAGVDCLRSAGVEVIVTDHHLPGPQLPGASALVNPNLPGDPFPSPNLAGVGVMFYTLIALRAELRKRGHAPEFRLDSLLDLVALGTVADLVKLDENNRRLVHQGLLRIRARRCQPGLAALLEIGGRNLAHVSAADLGFVAGPRLNAAGRLDDISIGIRCLLEDDESRSGEHAETLDALNRDRQQLQAEMTQQAVTIADQMLEQLDSAPCGYCLSDPDWHPGVVGLVASRICEQRRRPVIALAPAGDDSDEWKGSCRSPEGVHMRDLLVAVDAAQPGLMERFGGHARAAGLSLPGARLQEFQAAFTQQADKLEFAPDQVCSDGDLSAKELSVETAQALIDAGPWGQGWDEPLFDGRFRVLERRVVGQGHLKLLLEPASGGPPLDAIAFRAGALCHNELPDPFHVTYRLEINRWRGRVTPQLNIQHRVVEVS